jgi:hypothetical protein
MLGAFALPAVAQVDPDPNSILNSSQSIESETTFDLFENEYDYMLMPAYTGFFEDNGRFYTQLGNTGGDNNFQFGHYRPMGPGYFSFRVAIHSETFETDVTAELQDFDDDPGNGFFQPPNIFTDAESIEQDSSDITLYGGYAWTLSDDGSLGFGVEYFEESFEFEDELTSIDDQRAGLGSPLSDDETLVIHQEFESSQQSITLLGEYMRRGDRSWRVRGFVQDVDNEVENSTRIDDEILFDNDDQEGFPVVRFEQQRNFVENAVFTGNGGIEGFGATFLDQVSYDGLRFGAEGDLRFESNPELEHQLNVGVSTSSLEAKDGTIFSDIDTQIFEAANGDRQITTITDQHVISSDDISWDSFFATWKTRWHRGDTHVGAGLYFFYNALDMEVTTDLDGSFLNEFEQSGDITFRQESLQEGVTVWTHDQEFSSFSIPIALEQDITDRVQLRLGAQYLISMFENEWRTDDNQGNFVDITDGDGDGSGDPVETVTDNRQVVIDTLSFEDTLNDFFYHAGLAVEFDRVTFEVLLTSDSSSNTDREGVDLDTAYLGATFKLGQRN